MSFNDHFSPAQASLLSQTQTAEVAKKASAGAEAKNGELTKKLKDEEKKVDQLQDSVQRFVTYIQ